MRALYKLIRKFEERKHYFIYFLTIENKLES